MNRTILAGTALAAVLALLPAAADEPQAETIKDRAGFIPARKQVELPGTAVGLLLAEGQPVLSTEGRSGPPDQLVFASGPNSYRWVYVPTMENPTITNLPVPLPGGKQQVYGALAMANPRSVVPWGVTEPYTLVEVQVNGGQGSPAGDSFVATGIKVLEGTKEYPLKAGDVIARLKARHAADLKARTEKIEATMAEVGRVALGGRKPTGPRETAELMYVTWLPESSTLRVHFRTRISDGAYSMVGGQGALIRDPETPIPPKAAPRAAPPRPMMVRTGTTFGIEFGTAYEVTKDGKLGRTAVLPIESFTQQLAPPPSFRPGLPRPRPLPIRPVLPREGPRTPEP